jgi:hypothetical protein
LPIAALMVALPWALVETIPTATVATALSELDQVTDEVTSLLVLSL